jgi:hypothetical protein
LPFPLLSLIFDIDDDTVDVVHGISSFRCSMPITTNPASSHIYDTAVSRPVALLLHPGKTPSGKKVADQLRRLVRHIRQH